MKKLGYFIHHQLNSALNTEKLQALEDQMDFQTVIETYELGEDNEH
ncbi:hypothetical protein JCM19233_6259 [Vibrio astriarenae]|nr:hypothetical protein JCM19233_6259 [Vibrio sp. C7]